MSEPLYYIQDKRDMVGNSMLWWKKGGHGYGCDIREAEVFPEDRAKALIETSGDKYRMWPKNHIDAHVKHHVDFQCVNDKLAVP